MDAEIGGEGPLTTFNILFVCTGNTCRSPLAEALARAEVERRGWQHVQVVSAGVTAEPGSGASTHAVTVGARRGLDLSHHRSQPLTPELLDWADLVLTMGHAHQFAVERMGGADKVALLGGFAAGEEETGGGGAVADPYGGEESHYEETLRELRQLVSASLDRLAPILHP